MPWPEPGSDWEGKTAAELRPVIVALCNAVGDRYQCIGLNRPEWPVNDDQAIDSVTVGTKSATLVEDDLYGLDIFRYGWWTMIANHISTLVGLGVASTGSTGFGNTTQCGGFSKTSAGTGLDTDLWTIADLETAVGLGTLSSSSVGGAMHLFDEVAPNRLRGFLDRLIYPVIFPYDRGQGWSGLTSDGFDTSAIETAEAASNSSNAATVNPLDGDEAWGSRTTMISFLASYPTAFVGFYEGFFARSRVQTKRYSVLGFDSCQNGVGCLGEIITQILGFAYSCTDCDGADLEFQGATISMSGTDGAYTTATGTLFSAITGKLTAVAELGNFANDPDSPFSGTGTYEGDPWNGFGEVYCKPLFRFAVDTERQAIRDNATRLILDITAHCDDQ